MTNNYNLASLLSPLRFEQLARDLLRSQYGNFENFAEGKDQGIDFRYSQSNEDILVVQCKRYKNTRQLISNLKKEVIKNQNLKFTKYILVVSVDLSPLNKAEIQHLYKGRIQNANQIITNADLNDLLSHPSNQHIEFKFPELWMSSVSIHQKIFDLGFLKHSDFIKTRLKESLKNFVPYKEYSQIIEHLKSNNVVIIAGNPGIGKTTLAYALISSFVYFHDFHLIDFTARTIQEAESYIYANEPTIFFMDDFLGDIKLKKDSDFAKLLSFFIEKIENEKNKKLIITSREYILKKAIKELFPMEEISQTISKYTIEIKSFTRRIRTEILYNHLKNSDLEISFIENFLQNDFKRIIDHKNYNPRIIEHLTNTKRLKDIKAEDYFDFFTENINKPSKIWQHVYQNFPNDLYKIIILTKFIISESLSLLNLEKAIIYLIENDKKFHHFSFDDFGYITREMEGTIFTFQVGYDELIDEEYSIIEFHNPSIKDFIDSFIWRETKWLNLIINNAIYFEQLFNWELLETIKENNFLQNLFIKKVLKDFNNLENASFGFFHYEVEQRIYSCWIPERYNYYLDIFFEEVVLNYKIDLNDRREIADFLKREIFRYTIEDTVEISEKVAFSKIVTELLKIGLVNSEDAINHYTDGFCNDIGELVYLEYMTRYCTEESLLLIKNNKELVRQSDNLFLEEIESIEEKDFVDLLDFYDDFVQIKSILPLRKTTKILKALNYDRLMEKSVEKLKKDDIEQNNISMDIDSDEKNEQQRYYDISDENIKHVLKNLKKI